MSPLRARSVFLDSSVLIAATISARGRARDLLRKGFNGEMELWISQLVLIETSRNLSAKAPETLADFELFRAALEARLVAPALRAIAIAATIVAEKDAPIIAAAVQARARFLATYDRKHLLRVRAQIAERFGVVTATPDEILGLL